KCLTPSRYLRRADGGSPESKNHEASTMPRCNRTLLRRRPGPRAVARVQREVRSLVRPYEVMVILDAGLGDDAVRASIDRVTELIRARGGNPGRVDRWVKRRLAYEIDHKAEGYYLVSAAT